MKIRKKFRADNFSKITGLVILFCTYLSCGIAQVSNVSGDKFSVEINGSVLKIPFYSNYDIFSANPEVDKAVLVIHGTNRNADDYFENMITAAGSVAEMTQNTIVVAPQFLIEEDIDFHALDAEHLYWSNGGWKAGSNSKDEDTNPRPARIPSYAVLDSLLFHLANNFTNLESIVLTGHSAGAQVAHRMAATSPMQDVLCSNFQISIRYVVANPSSYLYMDEKRKAEGSSNEFDIPNTTCDGYNEWKYGLENLYTYPALSGADSIRNMYQRRQVTYMLGENDNDPNSSSLDTSCEANFQGEHRYERGETYYDYLQFYYGDEITNSHSLPSVPGVGHNNFDMYNSEEGVYELFLKFSVSCNVVSQISLPPEELAIYIYPNPTRGAINISISPSKDDLQVLIFSLNGHLIQRHRLENQDNSIDVSGLNQGMYIVQVQSRDTSICKKIVVNK